MTLPTTKQSRETAGVTPERARVMLVGTPGSGKTTLGAAWAPETTLIIDTQGGTILLDGEHYVQHVNDWDQFVATVDDLVTGQHPYKTVVVDLIDDIWNFCDKHHAGKNAILATSTDDFQKSRGDAIGMFRTIVGRLLASDLGVWFVGHAREKTDGKMTRYQAELNTTVRTYIQGAVQFIFLTENLGPRWQLHTQPSGKWEAKSRVPMPEPMDIDAQQLWRAMNAGLNPKKKTSKGENGSVPDVAPETAGATA